MFFLLFVKDMLWQTVDISTFWWLTFYNVNINKIQTIKIVFDTHLKIARILKIGRENSE